MTIYAVHPVQNVILDLAAKKQLGAVSLREIGKHCDPPASPQQVKHHMTQLIRYGYLDIIGGKYRVNPKIARRVSR